MLTRGLEPKKLIGIGTALLFVLAACGDDSDDSDTTSGDTTDDQEQDQTEATGAPALFGDHCDENGSFVATAVTDGADQIEVFAEPGSEPLHSFDTKWTSAKDLANPDDGTPMVFLLTDDRDQSDDEWLHVELPLPIPDNDTTEAYIQASDVFGSCHNWEITVDRANFELTLTDGGEVKMTADVGLGNDERATEPGEYFTTEVIGSDNPAYGNYAWAINGFSDDPAVIDEFADNPLGLAVVGIHGTHEPEKLPGNVSNGCIRLKNEDIDRFVEEFQLPYGVPVHVV